MHSVSAKQSQFASPWAGKTIDKAKGLDAATRCRDNRAKQSQFSLPWAEEAIPKAKGLEAATRHGGNCAKQSQFGKEFQVRSVKF